MMVMFSVPSFAVFYEFSASSLLQESSTSAECYQGYDALSHVFSKFLRVALFANPRFVDFI